MTQGQQLNGKCSLERHRAETDALLTPLLTRLTTHPGEELSIADPELVGRVLATEHRARAPIPNFDNSQMDGYAVRFAQLNAASVDSPVRLPIARVIAAGDPPGTHAEGTASPIMTGAPIPFGADAVVPIELTVPPEFPPLTRDREPESTQLVTFTSPTTPGRFVRRQGEDLPEGSIVGAPGARITPTLIGALAAAGVSRVSVQPRPHVLLCSTGDELSEYELTLQPGRIYDANTPMLRAALLGLGATVTLLRTGDTAAELHDVLQKALGPSASGSGHEAAHRIDLVVTMGGISRGAFEVVREAFKPLGVDFHSVAIQPGGPQGLGSLPASPTDGEHTDDVHAADTHPSVPVLCFPGNPVSAILSFELFLAPILRSLAGLPADRDTTRLPLAHSVDSPVEKHQIRRATVDSKGRVTVLAPGSHMINELASAQLLAHFPVGVDHVDAGTLVDTWRFND